MVVGRCLNRFCVVVNVLIRWTVTIIMVAVLCFAFYDIGQTVGESKAKVEIIEKKVEIIRYVEKKKADIYSLPNANRDELLRLMLANKL